MPTDDDRWTHPARYALRAAAWSLGVFGLLRLGWVETHALLPLTKLQAQLGAAVCGTPGVPVGATLACGGADAMALCLGAVLGYPAAWPMRLAGAVGGLVFVLALNTLRIGTLGLVAASPEWFHLLHVFVWPLGLILAIPAYVFWWMGVADGGARPASGTAGMTGEAPAATGAPGHSRTRPFIVLATVCVILFIAAAPLYLTNASVLAVAAFITRLAAAMLGAIGVDAHATANVLWTSRGGFAVTQECISTPLIPIYLAAVLVYPRTWRLRALGLAAAAPLVVGLGVARLLVVALPATIVTSPLVLIHAFYQVLMGGVVVAVAAVWRHGARARAWRPAITGMALGVTATWLLGAAYARALTRLAAAAGASFTPGSFVGTHLGDPQGAIALLPAFQLGLYLALWLAAFTAAGWRRFSSGLVILAGLQLTVFVALQAVADFGLAPHVRDVRAWALAGPLLVVAAVVRSAADRRAPAG